MSDSTHNQHHIDSETGKLGMWLFLFTELFLFGGLFLVYAVLRVKYSADFHKAALELDTFIGALNTVVLLVSSMTVAMSISAIQKGQKSLAIWLNVITVTLAMVFMVNKYFEWTHKFHLHLWPGSEVVRTEMPRGELLFIGLYYMMTGLHALHVMVGATLLVICIIQIRKNKITSQYFLMLENSGLYWHLVDLIWIFLFPLLYLIT